MLTKQTLNYKLPKTSYGVNYNVKFVHNFFSSFYLIEIAWLRRLACILP